MAKGVMLSELLRSEENEEKRSRFYEKLSGGACGVLITPDLEIHRYLDESHMAYIYLRGSENRAYILCQTACSVKEHFGLVHRYACRFQCQDYLLITPQTNDDGKTVLICRLTETDTGSYEEETLHDPAELVRFFAGMRFKEILFRGGGPKNYDIVSTSWLEDKIIGFAGFAQERKKIGEYYEQLFMDIDECWVESIGCMEGYWTEHCAELFPHLLKQFDRLNRQCVNCFVLYYTEYMPNRMQTKENIRAAGFIAHYFSKVRFPKSDTADYALTPDALRHIIIEEARKMPNCTFYVTDPKKDPMDSVDLLSVSPVIDRHACRIYRRIDQ